MNKDGRPPSENPKDFRKNIRLDKESMDNLKYLSDRSRLDTSQADVIRIAINYLANVYKSNVEPLDTKRNELNDQYSEIKKQEMELNSKLRSITKLKANILGIDKSEGDDKK